MMNIFLGLVKVQSYFGTIGLITMMHAILRGFLDPDFKRIKLLQKNNKLLWDKKESKVHIKDGRIMNFEHSNPIRGDNKLNRK